MAKQELQITMSRDGYVAGPQQRRQVRPSVGGERIPDWEFIAHAVRQEHTMERVLAHCRFLRSSGD